jgi:predicted nucleic acid-binding protein
MSADDAFFDTNVLLYSRSNDDAKLQRSEELLRRGGGVSVQVLNEFTNVARRKLRLDWPELRSALASFRLALRVEPITLETHERGLALAQRYGFATHDAMIAASAVLAGCKILYTEDMRDGLVIGELTLRNPYTAPLGSDE